MTGADPKIKVLPKISTKYANYIITEYLSFIESDYIWILAMMTKEHSLD